MPVPGANTEFTVRDEAVLLKGGPGFLQTDDVWQHFVLQAEARTNAKNVNSGIFFRAMPGTEQEPSNGYELQIHNGFADGDRTKPNDYQTGFGTGAIFRRQKVRKVVSNDNEWFTLTLMAHGAHFPHGSMAIKSPIGPTTGNRTKTPAAASAGKPDISSCRRTTRRPTSRSAIYGL